MTQTKHKPHALIVGAGISGLAVALALQQQGWHCTLFERAQTLERVGSALVIWPNAQAVLHKLGLGPQLAALAPPALNAEMRTAQGQSLVDLSIPRLQRLLGGTSLALERPHLIGMLYQQLAPAEIEFGAQIQALGQDAQGVWLTLANGQTHRGDVLIGADGIHSQVRQHINGPQPIRYRGYAAWRGIANYDEPKAGGELLGQGWRAGMARLPNGKSYWFVTQTRPIEAAPPSQHRAYLLSHLRDWPSHLRDLIANTDEQNILYHPINELSLQTRWCHGRIALLGDAAHAMTPNLAQGACQSLEDAWVLAQSLAQNTDYSRALQRYQRKRWWRASLIAVLAWSFGWMGQWRNPALAKLRNALLRYILAPLPIPLILRWVARADSAQRGFPKPQE
jgi:2-polyprenyl-6-methoxyphenol hydroxylase-like FAD-dependent oxidoreductase